MTSTPTSAISPKQNSQETNEEVSRSPLKPKSPPPLATPANLDSSESSSLPGNRSIKHLLRAILPQKTGDVDSPVTNPYTKQLQEKLVEIIKEKLGDASGDQQLSESYTANAKLVLDLTELSNNLLHEAKAKELELEKQFANNEVERKKKLAELKAASETHQVEIKKQIALLGQQQEKHSSDIKLAHEEQNLKREEVLYRQKQDSLKFAADMRERELQARFKAASLPIASQGKPASTLTTPFLHQFAREGNLASIESFVSAGFSIDELHEGYIPLAIAIREGHLEVAKSLTTMKVQKNFRDPKGQTYLHLAVRSGKKEMVEWVAKWSKNDLVVKDKRGRTPAALAISLNQLSILKMLIEQMKADRLARDNENRSFLHIAAIKADVKLLDWLLTSPPLEKYQLEVQDKAGFTPLQQAILHGKIEQAKLLAIKGANNKVLDKDQRTLLHLAASKGFDDGVLWCLDLGLGLEDRSRQSFTPLASAVNGGHTQTARLLLEKKAAKDLKTAHKDTLYHIAAETGSVSTCDLLSSFGLSLEETNAQGQTPLQVAVLNGKVDVAEDLARQGAKLDGNTNAKENILHLAVLSGVHEMVEWVLKLPNDKVEIHKLLEGRDEEDKTPLATAVVHNKEEIVKTLLKKGADSSVVDKKNRGLLHLAINASEDLIDHLVNVIKFYNLTDDEGNSALHLAISHGKVIYTNKLIAAGAAVDTRNKEGESLIHAAAALSNPELVQLVLSKVTPALALIESSTVTTGETPLAYAVKGGHVDTVSALLDAGAKTDVKNKTGGTLLHLVSSRGPAPILHTLLEKGLNPNDPDGQGITPIQVAVEHGQLALAKRLAEKGATVDSVLDGGQTLVHKAVLRNQVHLLDWLILVCKLDKDKKDGNDLTPLALAIQTKNLSAAQKLAQLQCDLNCRLPGHLTYMHLAVDSKADDLVRWLHTVSTQLEKPNEGGFTPLQASVRKGDLESAKLLVSLGATHKVLDSNQGSLLHVSAASQENQGEMIKWLVEKCGLGIDGRDNSGATPLYTALINKRLTNALELDRYKPDLNNLSIGLPQPLIHTLIVMGYTEGLQWLLTKKIDVEVRNRFDFTPLQSAVLQSWDSGAKMLLDAGAKPVVNATGNNLLHLTVSTNGVDTACSVFEWLPALGNARNNQRATPLHHAIGEGQIALVKVFHEKQKIHKQTMVEPEEGNLLHIFAKFISSPSKIADHTLLELVTWLIDQGNPLDGRDKGGLTPLERAVHSGNLVAAKVLHKKILETKALDTAELGKLLHLALSQGQADAIEWLLEAGAKMDHPCWPEGPTPFATAVDGGQLAAAKLLKDKKADVTLKPGSSSWLYRALFKGDINMLEWLSTLGDDVNAVDPYEGYTPLQKAVLLGRRDLVPWLLSKGAKVTASPLTHENLLHLALRSKQEGAIQWIYDTFKESGTMAEDRNMTNYTPVTQALSDGRLAEASWLYTKTSRTSYTDSYVRAMFSIALDNDSEEQIKWLFEKGFNPEIRNNNGETVLQESVGRGLIQMAKTLVQVGAKPDAEHLKGLTLHHIAALRDDEEQIMWLANVLPNKRELRDHEGLTPLASAVLQGKLKAAKRLIAMGADEAIITPNRGPLIHVAVESNCMETVNFFLKPDIRIESKNSEGLTPYQWAVFKGLEGVAEFLRVKGANIQTTNETLLSLAISSKKLSTVQWAYPLYMETLKDTPVALMLPMVLSHVERSIDQGSIQIAKWLLEQNSAHLKLEDSCSQLLHHLSQRDRHQKYPNSKLPDTIEALIALGAKIDEKDFEGFTALQRAVLHGDLEAAKALQNKGASLKLDQPLPLVHLSARQGSSETLAWLKEQGLDIEQAIASGQTPFVVAVEAGRLAAVRYLLDQKVKLPGLFTPFNPLIICARIGAVEILKEVLPKYNDDPSALNSPDILEGLTPLQVAVKAGKERVVEYLQSLNVDIQKCTPAKETLMHLAVHSGSLSMVQRTFRMNKEFTIALNTKGQTPLDVAIETKKDSVVAWLRSL